MEALLCLYLFYSISLEWQQLSGKPDRSLTSVSAASKREEMRNVCMKNYVGSLEVYVLIFFLKNKTGITVKNVKKKE